MIKILNDREKFDPADITPGNTIVVKAYRIPKITIYERLSDGELIVREFPVINGNINGAIEKGRKSIDSEYSKIIAPSGRRVARVSGDVRDNLLGVFSEYHKLGDFYFDTEDDYDKWRKWLFEFKRLNPEHKNLKDYEVETIFMPGNDDRLTVIITKQGTAKETMRVKYKGTNGDNWEMTRLYVCVKDMKTRRKKELNDIGEFFCWYISKRYREDIATEEKRELRRYFSERTGKW